MKDTSTPFCTISWSEDELAVFLEGSGITPSQTNITILKDYVQPVLAGVMVVAASEFIHDAIDTRLNTFFV